MSVREIARRLHVSRQVVSIIIAQKGQMPQPVRAIKNQIDTDLLRRLYVECAGWIQRMRKKLAEDHHIKVKYSTLTWMLRNLGISKNREARFEFCLVSRNHGSISALEAGLRCDTRLFP